MKKLISILAIAAIVVAVVTIYVYPAHADKAPGSSGGPRRFENRKEERMKRLKERKERQENKKEQETSAVTESEAANDSNVSDSNEPNTVDPNVFKTSEPNEPNIPIDPNLIMESLNLKDFDMKNIMQKLAEWTGKVVIPDDEAMNIKITIYSPQEIARPRALALIYSALQNKGIIAEETEYVIYLKPISKARLAAVPTIPADYPLAAIENKDQVVQKFFQMRNYSPTQMSNIVLPLVGEHGTVIADEGASTLLVIDTVRSLIRIEKIIKQFDIPGATETVEEIFRIHDGDPAEIVQLLEILMGQSRRDRGRPERREPPRRDHGKDGTAKTVTITSTKTPIILIPLQQRKWIIAKGSAEDVNQIGEWIEKLDRKEKIQSEYETVMIKYADVREVADRLSRSLRQTPGTDLKTSVLVEPLSQSRQILIFGRPELRNMVKKLLAEIDVPPGTFEEKVFDLKHADAEEIKSKLDELYSEQDPSGRYDYYYYRYGRQENPSEKVRVIAYPMTNQVSVMASPENMRKIEKQIAEWDIPLDVEKVKPLIITLHNSDPEQMAKLLSELFTEDAGGGDDWFDRYFFGRRGRDEEQKKIVGALYGQLTFKAVPGTKKIIVISKIAAAYEVIKELITELDGQEMAETPEIFVLQYADPEDLAERLNAIFNAPGTVAKIRYSETGLSQLGMEGDESESGKDGKDNNNNQGQGQYQPWWNTGGRRDQDVAPISNVIGRVRFVPDPRSKSIMCLAPPEFMEDIGKIITKLDVPGKQVMIKAIVLEVRHDDLTSLGLKIASDPSAFGALGENSLAALSGLSYGEEGGGMNLSASLGGDRNFVFTASINVNALVDLLVKKVDAKILNQQTLWTKDNEEADFFKGQKVAFSSAIQFSQQGERDNQSFEYERVGMTLRIRPNVTPQNKVNMEIDLTMSQVANELINNQPVRTEMNTTTYALSADGETVMLGGILFQESSQVKSKIAGLGDIPGIGGLFRHKETVESNNELIIFITPYVVDEEADAVKMLPETADQIEKGKERLDDTLEEFGHEAMTRIHEGQIEENSESPTLELRK